MRHVLGNQANDVTKTYKEYSARLNPRAMHFAGSALKLSMARRLAFWDQTAQEKYPLKILKAV